MSVLANTAWRVDVYLEPRQRSKMKLSAKFQHYQWLKAVNCCAKHSLLDAGQRTEYASVKQYIQNLKWPV